MRNLTLLFLSLILLFSLTACSGKIQSAMAADATVLEDGMYLIKRSGNRNGQILPLAQNEKIIAFNQLFFEKTDTDVRFLVIDPTQFAPLKLKEKPVTAEQEDKRKKLFLKMNEEGTEQLKQFTTKHLNKLTTIVVGGEALTMHKIRAVIDGGMLQITRCTDNACELLFMELQDNVVK